MTPSNPSNNNAFIYRILDALGIAHQVVPVDHTHSKSDVEGLESSLDTLAREIYKISGNQTAIVRCKESSGNVQILLSISDYEQLEAERKAIITWQNMPNLQRALLDPDSVPTANSHNIVTSGGVKTALDAKQDTLTFDTTPTANSTNPVTSGGVKTALDGKANSSHSHTVSQITDFNSAVATKVNAGVSEAIRGVAIKDVEVDANTTYDLDDHMADMNGRQALILLTNADPQEDSIYKYIISGTGIDISFDDSNRKLENGVTYLISIIYMKNETTYHNGWYFVSVLSTFS